MENLELIIPSQKYKIEIETYIKDYLTNNEIQIIKLFNIDNINNLDRWINEINLSINKCDIPFCIFFTVRKPDNKIIGHVIINHYLNNDLFNSIGHIQSDICPSERNNNYYDYQLKLSLKKCKELKIDRVLIYSYKENNNQIQAIISNGGILKNELQDSNSKIVQKYRISLKKRYANRHKIKYPNTDLIFLVKSITDPLFKGDVTYYNFKNSGIKIILSNNKAIIDNNYKLLGFYDYNAHVKLSAFYNDNNEIIEWYFDIATKIGKENDVPYEDDLYLDVVVSPTGNIVLLDEDELQNALNRFEITQEEYELAYSEAYKLMSLLEGNHEKLKEFTDKYLNYFESITK